MKVTHFISKHIEIISGEYIGNCCICGDKDTKGFKSKNVLSSNFTDTSFLKMGNIICNKCSACLGYKQPNGKSLRYSSFICTEKKLILLKREQIYKHILNTPNIPFIFCITFSYKKHLSYKSILNYISEKFYIRTDNATVKIDLKKDKKLLMIINDWYTKKTEKQTYFTKKDILNGCSNFKKIKDYGLEKYNIENKILSQYRNTILLQLYVYILNINKKDL